MLRSIWDLVFRKWKSMEKVTYKISKALFNGIVQLLCGSWLSFLVALSVVWAGFAKEQLLTALRRSATASEHTLLITIFHFAQFFSGNASLWIYHRIIPFGLCDP